MFLLLPWCLALALAVSLSPIAEANTDTQGWVHVGGRYLKFYATPMNWDDAQTTCRSVGGLVVYDDNAAVNAYLARNGLVVHSFIHSMIIGIRFLICAGKTRFPIFACGSLKKLGHFLIFMRLMLTLTLKIV